MSTKIHNGFKFKSNNIKEIHKQIITLKEEIKNIANLELTQHIYEKAIDKFDTAYVLNQDKNLNFIYEARKELIEEVKKQNSNSEFNVDCEFIIFPYGKSFYGMYFTCNNTIEQAIQNKKDILEDFSYWNNTDKPENISEIDWKKRERVWDRIFKDDSIPSQVGFKFELAKTDVYLDLDLYKGLIKKIKFEKRIINKVIDKTLEDISQLDEVKSQSIGHSFYFGLIREISEYMNGGVDKKYYRLTEQFKEMVNKNKQYCEQIMIKEVSFDELKERKAIKVKI